MWSYRFSQLKGSSDDGKSKLKLLFLNDVTQQVDSRVIYLLVRTRVSLVILLLVQQFLWKLGTGGGGRGGSKGGDRSAYSL